MNELRSGDIHARVDWPTVLAQLGVPEAALRRKKQQPCPLCGGRDRYCFDNRRGRGDYIWRHCGAGDGFQMLMRFHGWTFSQTRQHVLQVLGATDDRRPQRTAVRAAETRIARPTPRVLDILRRTCEPANCADARDYLASRGLWPLPAGCSLQAHAGVEYWEGCNRLGRFPALVAEVLDVAGELVTVHLTYLQRAQKITDHEPRKILSSLHGHDGCAVRLVPLAGDILGVGEGVETCLAAQRIHGVPVWAALNTALLSRFEPPPEVRKLIVFADRDVPGLEAAGKLLEHLQGRISVELRPPPAPAKDWNDMEARP